MNQSKLMNPDRIYLKNRNRLVPDWEAVFTHLFNEGAIHKDEVKKIFAAANRFFGKLIRS